MELRFPAPSSDEAIPLDSSTSGTTPAPLEASAIKGATESNALAATYHRVTDGPTMTSVAPVYRSISVPRKGDSPVLSKGTDEDGNHQSSTAASVAVVPNSSTPDPAGNPSSAAPASSEPASRAPKLWPQRRQRVRLRHLLPAWSVSLLVHVVILSALAAATFSAQDRDKKPINFDSALAGYRQSEREELNVWADPANIPRDQAVGNEHGGASGGQPVEVSSEGGGESDDGDGGGMVVAAAFGSGAPSATPRFRGTGKRGINEAAV